MASHTVLLDNNTVGTIITMSLPIETYVGKRATVWLHDENGTPINVRGVVVEILSSNDY